MLRASRRTLRFLASLGLGTPHTHPHCARRGATHAEAQGQPLGRMHAVQSCACFVLCVSAVSSHTLPSMAIRRPARQGHAGIWDCEFA